MYVVPCDGPEGQLESFQEPKRIHQRKKEEEIHGLWDSAFGGTSSNRCKEGGIDGRVDPRTGADERISLTHCTGVRHDCVGFGECLFESFCWNLTLGGDHDHLTT